MGTRNNAIRRTLNAARKLSAAIVIGMIAFFELCFTARADGTWRLARADNRNLSEVAGAKGTPIEHPIPRLRNLYLVKGRAFFTLLRPLRFFLSRSIIVAVIAILIIAIVLLSIEPNVCLTKNFFNHTDRRVLSFRI